MLDHIIDGLRDAVTITHRGDVATLTVWRSSTAHGTEPRFALVTQRGERFTVGADALFDGQRLDLTIRHAGGAMLARLWYGHRGSNEGRFLCSLQAAQEWRFAWERRTQHAPERPPGKHPEPEGFRDGQHPLREAGDPARVPGRPATDRRRRAGPLSHRSRR